LPGGLKQAKSIRYKAKEQHMSLPKYYNPNSETSPAGPLKYTA